MSTLPTDTLLSAAHAEAKLGTPGTPPKLRPPVDGKPGAKPRPKSARSIAREFCLQALYQHLIAGHYVSDLIAQYENEPAFGRADAKFFSLLLRGVTTQEAELVEALTPALDRTWGEVMPIEKSILLIGAFELVKMLETPYRVALNESIELAKIFGGPEAHRYVNGVLDKLAASVRGAEMAQSRTQRPPRS